MNTYFVLAESAATQLTDAISFLVEAKNSVEGWRLAERAVHARTCHTSVKYVIVKFEVVE